MTRAFLCRAFEKTISASFVARSDSNHWGVEEDAAREVGVAPLSERGLLLEVLLHTREILRLQTVVVALVRCAEPLGPQGRSHILLSLVRDTLGLVAQPNGLGATAAGLGRASGLQTRQ